MKALLLKYKPILIFIASFLGTYIVLTALYSLYLSYFNGAENTPDPITELVSEQTRSVVESFGYASQVIPETGKPSMALIIEGVFLARIVEGCNAISIMILFAAFVIAFYDGMKKTLLFIFAGLVLLYAVNILRIAFLGIALYKYPEYGDFLHGILFPVIIYGMVFALWVFWVKNQFKKPTE